MKKKKQDKWGKKKLFVITAEPYNQEIAIVCNGQFSDYVKFLKKQTSSGAKRNIEEIEKAKKLDEEAYKDEHINNTGTAQTYTELPIGYVVTLSHQNDWIKTTGLVVHECLHLTHYILRRAGIILSKESEEAFTYLQEELVTKILKEMY